MLAFTKVDDPFGMMWRSNGPDLTQCLSILKNRQFMMTKHACVNTCLPVNIYSAHLWLCLDSFECKQVRLGRVLRGAFGSHVSATSIICYNNDISVFVPRHSRAGSWLNLIMLEVSIFVVSAFKMRNFSTFSPIVY